MIWRALSPKGECIKQKSQIENFPTTVSLTSPIVLRRGSSATSISQALIITGSIPQALFITSSTASKWW